jgi:hypothetical protein
MHRIFTLSRGTFLCCSLILASAGCGGGEKPQQPTASISSGQNTTKSASQTPQATVVQAFLQAVQQGDRDTALGLLTAKAVQKINEHNLPFLPSAIDSGSFRIGQTVERGTNYFVQCVWMDQDASGQPRSETIQWMVKQEEGADWGIFGMAVMDQKDQPLVINFEEPPDEMLRRNSQARQQQEVAQQSGTQPVAGQPASPEQTARPQDPFQPVPR